MVTTLTDNLCRACGGSTGDDVATHEAKADPHPAYLLETDAAATYATAAAITAAVSAHSAASDPHPTYLTQAEADALYSGSGDGAAAVAAHVAAADPHPDYALESFAEDRTGWASYTDTALTSGAPLTLVASTPTDLPNNAGTTVETQLPSDVTEFFETVGSTIVFGSTTALLELQVELLVLPTTTAQWLDVWLEDGAGTEIARQTFSLVKGAVEHAVVWRAAVPGSANLVANGGTVRVESGDTPGLYDVRLLVARGHVTRTT